MNTCFAIIDRKTGKHYHLTIKWTVSKGCDTYGYNICSLWDVQGEAKLATCNGGGYDMEGTSFGLWLMKQFMPRLQKLNSVEFYGLTHNKTAKHKVRYLKYGGENKNTYVDGACGMTSMRRIAKAIKLEFV